MADGPTPPLRELATVLIEEPPPSSAASSTVTMMNSAIGAGILTLPYAFRCTGWVAGLACIAAVAALMSFTLYILSRFAEHTGSKTYGALVHTMLGKQASIGMGAVKFLFLFGGCTSYLMILGDSFHPLLLQAFGERWWTGRDAAIIAVGTICIFPLCLRTSLGGLKAVSSMAVSSIVVVVGAVLFSSVRRIRRPEHSWEGVRAFNPSLEFFGALPLIIFSFVCHHNVISVFNELESHPSLFRPSARRGAAAAARGPQQQQQEQQGQERQGPVTSYESLPSPLALSQRSMRHLKSSKLRGMVWVIAVSMSLVALLYCTIGLAGYLAFPADANPDILVSFGCTNMLMQVARASIGLVLIASYPVVHFPARAAISELLHHATGRQFVGKAFIGAEAVVFFASTLAIAVRCTDLGIVFKLIGGTCGAMLVLALPGALLMQYACSKHRDARQPLALLREPLLVAAAEEGGGSNGGSAVTWRVYSLWCSRLFWGGLALQLLAAAVAVLSVATILWDLPSA